MSQYEFLKQMMATNGEARVELKFTICQIEYPSRGAYIVLQPNGIFYLYDDGRIYKGVNESVTASPFWPTLDKAQSFFSDWKRQFSADRK
jgi:hypothetical protein